MGTGFIKNSRGDLWIYKTSLSPFVVGCCRSANESCAKNVKVARNSVLFFHGVLLAVPPLLLSNEATDTAAPNLLPHARGCAKTNMAQASIAENVALVSWISVNERLCHINKSGKSLPTLSSMLFAKAIADAFGLRLFAIG
jgi:hypothetical protein